MPTSRLLLHRARELRRNLSEPEVMLWVRLRKLREHGYRFRRQAPCNGYILDFVCYARRLVVEVDGWQHGDERQSEYDLIRDKVLTRAGFRVLRFSTGDVRREIGMVTETIWRALQEAPLVRNGRVDDPEDLRRFETSPP